MRGNFHSQIPWLEQSCKQFSPDTMKLMIVDDHPGARDIIRQLLTEPGVMICECACGEEAIWLADIFQPDWVTMDVRMNGLDGFKATRLLRNKWPGAHVVIVTNDDGPQVRKAALAAGAVGLVCKEKFNELRDLILCGAGSTENGRKPN